MPNSEGGSVASSVENTPKRTPSRRFMGSGISTAEKWERSIEKWDNSPKASRINRKAPLVADVAGISSEVKEHARTDSGSSSGSFVESVKADEAAPAEETVSKENKEEKKAKVSGSNTQSEEESLSDIAEEDSSNKTNSRVVRGGFFSRNAPERLSTLLKKGVGGADQKLRGFLKKGMKKSDSKDSVGSTGSGISTTSSLTSTDKLISPSVSDSSLQNNVERIGQSETDQKLFSMKGDQPRLFQSDPVTDDSKGQQNCKTSATVHTDVPDPVTVPVCPGRDKVVLGDPLGALDSPENSPPKDVVLPQVAKLESTSEELPRDPANCSVICETIYDSSANHHSEPISSCDSKSLSYDVDIKPSTVKMTKLTPLSVVLINDDGDTSAENSSVKTNNKEPTDKPQLCQRIPWSITPLGGSPFAVPLPIVANKSSTLPTKPAAKGGDTTAKSGEGTQSTLSTLPPLPPNTPNRKSRSPPKNKKSHGGRSISIGNDAELSSRAFTDENTRVPIAARTSNSLSSLSSISEGQNAIDELAPRQARTLDHSSSWALRKTRYLSLSV